MSVNRAIDLRDANFISYENLQLFSRFKNFY